VSVAALLWVIIKFTDNRQYTSRFEAARRLKQLSRINTPEQKISFLRGVDPFVFEEMILTTLKKRGYKIIRNKRYTGDGGIDGQVFINGHHYLIQAKRYKAHISAAHVQEFAQICRRRKARGLFVHTGKTGKQAAANAAAAKMEMISGQRLLDMFDTSHKAI
jgi:restriction system protein